MTLRDLDIDVDVKVKSDGLKKVDRDINKLVEDIQKIDDDILIYVALKDSDTIAELKEIKKQTDDLDRKKPKIDIDIDAAQVIAEIEELQRHVNSLDHEDVFIDVDIKDATKQLLLLRGQMLAIERSSIDIDVDTAAAHAQIAALQMHLKTLKPVSGGVELTQPFFSTGLGSMVKTNLLITGLMILLPSLLGIMQALVGLVGVLGVAIGVLAGGLLALASAVGVAAIGLGGFMLLGISSITALYEKNAKLSKAQQELKKHTDGLMESFDGLKKKLEPLTFGVITKGVTFLEKIMDKSVPTLTNATKAVDKLFESMDKSLDGQNMQNFFSYLERAVGPLTTNIGNGLGYALQGVLNTMVALEPLTSWIAQGFENMMGRFNDWTAGLADSARMQSFMDYVKQNLPVIGDIFKNTRNGVVDWFAAFDFTAAQGLEWMSQKTQEFATWAAQLGQDDSFQKFLQSIRENGPVIADTIGTITSNIVELTNALAGSGLLNTLNTAFAQGNVDYGNMKETFSLSRIAKSLTPSGMTTEILRWFDFGAIANEAKNTKVEIPVTANTSKAVTEIDNLVNTQMNTKELPINPKFNVLQPLQMPPLEAEMNAKINSVDTSAMGPLTAKVDKVEMPSTIKLNAELEKNAFGFVWPPLPRFIWPEFPMWVWSPYAKWVWPAYPKFSWPAIPTVKVSVLGLGGGTFPGFSTGLGRVQSDMAAIVHEEEAILPAHQAQTLRDMNVIQGEGRYPTLNTAALASTSNSNVSSSNSAKVEIGSIQVTVQGGNTNAETGNVITQAIENWFADMNLIMPVNREV